jgi:hypothetical protein
VSTSQVGLPGGVYYVKVNKPTDRRHSDAEYQVLINFTAATDWEQEVNDSFAAANVLPLGQVVNGTLHTSSDQDYYRVETLNPLIATLSFTHAVGTSDEASWEITLFDESSNKLDSVSSQSNEAAVWINSVSLGAGIYYIKVNKPDYRTHLDIQYSLAAQGTLSAGRPTIAGSAYAGKTLTVDPGAWGPDGVALGYQWLRNGTAIAGATGTSYKTVSADVGKDVAVQVTGSLSGYASASQTSGSVRIVKYASKAKISLKKSKIKKKSKPKVTIKVTTSATKSPTGKIVVKFGKKSKTYTLKAANKGKITVTGPKLTKKGSYKVYATYKGTWKIKSSKSAKKTLKVK